MATHIASDGRVFGNARQKHLYDMGLKDNPSSNSSRGQEDVKNAPGGEEHIANIKAHGIVQKSTIEFDGNGRWRHTAVHADGTESTSVHPQWFRAHDLQAKYFDPDGKPAALETHQRARSQPSGPKEEERLAREDGRETEED